MVWTVITDFGNSAAMLPAAALLLIWLAVNGQARAAILWSALFAGQAALVAASKIAFLGWGIGIGALDFTGFSGHSALACSVVPIGLLLAAQGAGMLVRIAAAAVGLAAGLLIGVSRIALAQHSWSEVVAGCALGAATTLLFALLSDRTARPVHYPAPAIAACLAVLLLMIHGTRAPSEELITRIALQLSGHSYPYTRDPWHRLMLDTEWDRSARAVFEPWRG